MTQDKDETYAERAKGYYKQGLANVANNPMPEGQKFPVGARVRIVKDLGEYMPHFPSDSLATVEYTYAHAYGGKDVKSYSLIVDGIGSVAWYYEHQLELIDQQLLSEIEE